MHLVINSVPIAPGGGLTVLLGLLEEWKSYPDLRVTVLASRPETCQALQIAGFGSMIHAVRVINVLAAQGWEFFKFPRLLKSLRADVLLTNNLYVPRCPCPQVVHHQTLWNLYMDEMWKYPLLSPLDFVASDRRSIRDVCHAYFAYSLRLLAQTWRARAALAHAEANVFISQYMRQRAEQIDPGSTNRNHVIYNGVSNDILQERLKSASVKPVPGRLITIGTPANHKDVITSLRVLGMLRNQKTETPWTLNVCGAGDWTHLRQMGKDWGLGESIQFMGHLDFQSLVRELCQSECLLFPSVLEGYGLPVIEAMACECPVVAVRATAIPEIAGDAACLVSPRSADEMTRAVLRLHNEPPYRQELVARGLRQVPKYSWARSARAFYELFDQMVNQGTKQ